MSLSSCVRPLVLHPPCRIGPAARAAQRQGRAWCTHRFGTLCRLSIRLRPAPPPFLLHVCAHLSSLHRRSYRAPLGEDALQARCTANPQRTCQVLCAVARCAPAKYSALPTRSAPRSIEGRAARRHPRGCPKQPGCWKTPQGSTELRSKAPEWSRSAAARRTKDDRKRVRDGTRHGPSKCTPCRLRRCTSSVPQTWVRNAASPGRNRRSQTSPQ